MAPTPVPKKRPPPGRRSSDPTPPTKRAATTRPVAGVSVAEVPNRPTVPTRPTAVPTRPTATTLIKARPLSNAAKALIEKAAKQAAAVQVGLGFNAVDKYPKGLKILLPESIYPSGMVRLARPHVS
jgi:hypothetical protein